MSCRLNYN